MLRINYLSSERLAEIKWDSADSQEPWVAAIKRLALDASEDASQDDGCRITLPWWNFIALRPQFFEVFKGFNLGINSEIEVNAEATALLRQSRQNSNSYQLAESLVPVERDILQSRLDAVGFNRPLSPEQTRNVSILAALTAGATFSVPGAGKTTEALANFFYKAGDGERLLVIAPKNAFAAWDEQLKDCLPNLSECFVRLRGGRDNIRRLLDAGSRFAIISYQQLTRVSDLVAAYCAEHSVHVYLDESHRIKSGVGKQTARAALSFSHLPKGKLIMSGTPMPQSSADLVPQLAFLYPELASNPDSVVDLIRPIYVRTTKAELGLPPITRNLISLPMDPVQEELYRLMKFEVARQGRQMTTYSRQAFRALGRSVARLLQFVSNPSLLSSEIGFAHSELLSNVLEEGEGPKLRYVLARARALARQGEKVLIWSSFVRNVEYLARRLSELGAVYIHGGVDAGDERDDDTREGKIRLFHDDANVRIMVANPAAASEGVSLHRVCHHAIYLDRTFNAAHYLQSEDRIHRFGLAPDQQTTIEIVECRNSVDETVRTRLGFKIGKMADALNDPSLRPDPIPIDPVDVEDIEEYTTGLSIDDVQALLSDLAEDIS